MLPEYLQQFAHKPLPVLDQGHVMLIDVMGDDMAIVDAARVSYGAGTQRVSEDRHLIRYLMRHRHCYDDQTEVLTSDGFVPWPDVWQHFRECDKQYDNECGIRLGIWDPAANTLCYEVPEYITCDHYQGDMYQVDHGGVNLLVTPDHKMWVRLKDQWDASNKSQGWSGFRLIPANELGDRSCVRYSKLAPMVAPMWTGEDFPPCNDPQALLELIGFFIGDGSARGSRANGIDFHLKKKREIEFLHECVGRVGWPMREFPSYDGRRKFCVYAEGIGHQFEDMFYWDDNKKHMPDWCLRLDRDDAAAVLYGMRHSDGSEKRGAWVYYTGSARLAEQVQILGLHAGEACHISQTEQGEPYDPMYRVMFMSKMREPVVNQGKVQTSMVPYEGNVYCAKTRTGILVVRRNGKIVLSGNTTPFEMCEIKFRVRVPMDVWRQWIRHRTASVNEYCLDPTTPVLRADLTWVPVADLEEGDDLLGFSEGPTIVRKNAIDQCKVLKKTFLKAPCHRITTEHGEVVSSDDHRWAARSRRGGVFRWIHTRDLQPGYELAWTTTPWTTDTTYRSGWLAGILDGEGWLSVATDRSMHVGVAQKPGDVLNNIRALFDTYNIPFIEYEQNPGCQTLAVSRRWEALRLLGTTRPQRLLTKFKKSLGQVGGLATTPSIIRNIETIGTQEVVGLSTSTKTFIANGFLSHNSTRYSEAIDAVAKTSPDAWRAQAKGNKQGSQGFIEMWLEGFGEQLAEGSILIGEDEYETPGQYLSAREESLHVFARDVYNERLAFGVAREVARKDLTLSTYTEAYWKLNLHNLLHFLSLRMDSHAQWEIRQYANVIAEVVKAWVPWAWEAFEDYRLHSMTLTRFEVLALQGLLGKLLSEGYLPDKLLAAGVEASGLPKGREATELRDKMAILLGIAS